jgi:hypothetical protein
MIKTAKKRIATVVVTHLVCDGCGLEALVDEGFEAQEFLRYRNTAGFASIFGDMNQIEIDLCQHCVKKRLGDIIRVK